ncbi:5'-3' exoribonuclease [Candidatus Brocadiaceae bacterium]|nr:5'-3' exoribonuclease [Candidatus Brocadiaceae bacterium]
MNYDLHSHSNTSDGALSPTALVERAHQQGVTHLALTDHDTTQGLSEARACAEPLGMTIINGIELSAIWENKSIHIVGLGINPEYAPLANAALHIQALRLERAAKMSEKLEKKRIMGAFQAVQEAAGNGTITRSHFADFLLSQGHVNTHQEAFERYLSRGKSVYVPSVGIDLPIAIQWINESGGVAVLAHPLRYQLTNTWLNRLLKEFKNAGGQAMEVVTGRTNNNEIKILATLAQRYQLAGSRGSDFHNPKHIYPELGRLFPLPDTIQPVWELLPC